MHSAALISALLAGSMDSMELPGRITLHPRVAPPFIEAPAQARAFKKKHSAQKAPKHLHKQNSRSAGKAQAMRQCARRCR